MLKRCKSLTVPLLTGHWCMPNIMLQCNTRTALCSMQNGNLFGDHDLAMSLKPKRFFFGTLSLIWGIFFYVLNIWQHFVLIKFKWKANRQFFNVVVTVYWKKETEIYVISIAVHLLLQRQSSLHSVFFFFSQTKESEIEKATQSFFCIIIKMKIEKNNVKKTKT